MKRKYEGDKYLQKVDIRESSMFDICMSEMKKIFNIYGTIMHSAFKDFSISSTANLEKFKHHTLLLWPRIMIDLSIVNLKS